MDHLYLSLSPFHMHLSAPAGAQCAHHQMCRLPEEAAVRGGEAEALHSVLPCWLLQCVSLTLFYLTKDGGEMWLCRHHIAILYVFQRVSEDALV